MARYFFHLIRDDEVIEDDVGQDFELAPEARGHALQVAAELSRNAPPDFSRAQIAVVDSNGVVVFRTRVAPEIDLA